MDERFSKTDRELFDRIGEVLHYIWDPIGVSCEPNARDEYSNYAPRCFSILKSCGDDPKSISIYLSEIREKNMGMPEDKSKNLAVAKLIIEWGKAYG